MEALLLIVLLLLAIMVVGQLLISVIAKLLG